jgi:hypothetical protein
MLSCGQRAANLVSSGIGDDPGSCSRDSGEGVPRAAQAVAMAMSRRVHKMAADDITARSLSEKLPLRIAQFRHHPKNGLASKSRKRRMPVPSWQSKYRACPVSVSPDPCQVSALVLSVTAASNKLMGHLSRPAAARRAGFGGSPWSGRKLIAGRRMNTAVFTNTLAVHGRRHAAERR